MLAVSPFLSKQNSLGDLVPPELKLPVKAGIYAMTRYRSSINVITALCLMILPLFQVSAAPPVPQPQACARTFCVEIIPQSPYSPHVINISSSLDDWTNTLTVDLGNGLFIAFHSKYAIGSNVSQSLRVPKWHFDAGTASAVGCLVCGKVGDRGLEVIGIAVKPLSPSMAKDFLKGSDVCYWPLQLESAGYGDGKHLSIGDKVCVKL